MALYGVTFANYGGLDLRDAADEANGAIDMLNIELDVSGRMRARDGFTKFTTSAAANPYLTLTALPGLAGGQIMGFLTTNNYEAVNATTGALVTTATSTIPVYNAALLTDAGTGITQAFFGNGSGINTWDGASNTIIIGARHCRYVNVTPLDHRLMQLYCTGIANTDTPSTVVFSDAGAGAGFTTNNFVQLDPGDGESISGVCNFANQPFVFKNTKFYVFTGTSTDSAGNPIFNYRTVNTGVGIHPVGLQAGCVSTPDGVYFFGKDGIYRTTGGAPVKVSAAIDPLFGVGGPVPPYFQGQAVSYTSGNRVFMHFYKNRVYISYDGPSARAMLIYDIPTQAWMYSNVAVNGMCTNPVSGALTFAYQGTTAPTNTNDLGAFSTSATTDAGTAITARYRSGFISFDYAGRTIKRGIQGVEKTVREMIVDGMGTVNARLTKQWVQPGSLPSAQALVLGTSPQVAQARARSSGNVRARMFSYQLDGTAPWTVEKVVLNIRDFHEVGLQQSGV